MKKRLLSLLLVLAMILVILTNALSLAGPKLSGLAIDAIGIGQGQADFEKLLLYTGLMALCYLASALTGYLLNRITIRLTRNTTYRMRKDVFDKLVSLPVGPRSAKKALAEVVRIWRNLV